MKNKIRQLFTLIMVSLVLFAVADNKTQAVTITKLGDTNLDGRIDVIDIQKIIYSISHPNSLTGQGYINAAYLREPVGELNYRDLRAIEACVFNDNINSCLEKYKDPSGDANLDGKINIYDIQKTINHLNGGAKLTGKGFDNIAILIEPWNVLNQSDFKALEFCASNSNKNDCLAGFKCVDSDGPKNFNTAGKTFGRTSANGKIEIKEWVDYCFDNNTAYDFKCATIQNPAADLLDVWSDISKCPNGCKDGACINKNNICAKNGETVYKSNNLSKPTQCCDANAGIKSTQGKLADGSCRIDVPINGSIGICVAKNSPNYTWGSCGNKTCEAGEDNCNCLDDCSKVASCGALGANCDSFRTGRQCCSGFVCGGDGRCIKSINRDFINNSNFEEGLSGWTDTANAKIVAGKSGKGIEIANDKGNSDVYQTLPGLYKKGKTYKISVWCKADKGEECRLFFGDANRSNGAAYENKIEKVADGNGQWQNLSVIKTLSKDEKMEVFLYAKKQGSLVIYDDVKIEQISAPVAGTTKWLIIMAIGVGLIAIIGFLFYKFYWTKRKSISVK